MYKLLMVKYGELGLKGKNKSIFINKLVKNIQRSLADLPERQVTSTWGRVLVPVYGEADMADAIERVKRVFGIYSISPALEAEKDMEAIGAGAVRVLKDALPKGGSFKIETRRSDKTFPLTSPEISQQIASLVFRNVGEEYVAQMQNPDKIIQIEVRNEGAYIYGENIPGAKGMPVGSGGKAVVMLSGGIDSPVAGWMAMKRGVTVEGVHFHSYPFTSERAKEKVIDLCKEWSKWSGNKIILHVVYFTNIQKAIRANCPEEYGITIMRRMMFRLAERIAHERGALAIYTGESVGQVASQTLESMYTINNVTNMPVLRPLVGMDKEEIMEIAKKIDTYDISIRPYEDCCTIFLPPHPKIRPRLAAAIEMEAKLDIEGLLREALEKTEVLYIQAED